MPRFEDAAVDRRELELVTREAELNRREARLRRVAEERADVLDAREQDLNRRERALVTLASELAAERKRLDAARAELLEELRRVERRRVQTNARLLAVAPEPSRHEDDWWAKVLGRPQGAP